MKGDAPPVQAAQDAQDGLSACPAPDPLPPGQTDALRVLAGADGLEDRRAALSLRRRASDAAALVARQALVAQHRRPAPAPRLPGPVALEGVGRKRGMGPMQAGERRTLPGDGQRCRELWAAVLLLAVEDATALGAHPADVLWLYGRDAARVADMAGVDWPGALAALEGVGLVPRLVGAVPDAPRFRRSIPRRIVAGR